VLGRWEWVSPSVGPRMSLLTPWEGCYGPGLWQLGCGSEESTSRPVNECNGSRKWTFTERQGISVSRRAQHTPTHEWGCGCDWWKEPLLQQTTAYRAKNTRQSAVRWQAGRDGNRFLSTHTDRHRQFQPECYYSPVARPHTHKKLVCLLTIISLHFSIVLSVRLKFSSPPAWLLQNPRWPPRWPK